MSDSDINHFSVLMEQMIEQNKAVLEYVAEIPKVVTRLNGIEHNVAELQQDMKVVKAAIRDISNHTKSDATWPPEHVKRLYS